MPINLNTVYKRHFDFLIPVVTINHWTTAYYMMAILDFCEVYLLFMLCMSTWLF